MVDRKQRRRWLQFFGLAPPEMPEIEEISEGQSLWSAAWVRLKQNRLSMVSLVVVLVMIVIGYSAPLISEHITHFSLDESHTQLAMQGPGSRDISLDHPTYDGEKAWFDLVDLNGDGVISCSLERQETLAVGALSHLRRFELGPPDEQGRVRTVYDVELEALQKETEILALSLEEFMAVENGMLRCPELDYLKKTYRFYEFLFADYDLVMGDKKVGPDAKFRKQPDGLISVHEYPATDADLPRKYQRRSLAGKAAFQKLDGNGDGYLDPDEVVVATRYLRFDKDHLIRTFDADQDLQISREEFPGAPELHTFWLGTDGQGRDLLTRIVYGTRISITIGLLATLISFLIGVSYGAIAGYFGGRVDNVMMRIVDVLYGLPFMFVVILLIVFVGRSTINLFIALGAVQWLTMSRVVRGQVISLKTREFVEAAEAIGVSRMGIVFKHLLRNTVGPVIVYSTLMVPAVIKEEAFLSFLGLGVQPPDPSWGNLISEGANQIENYTWLILYPGAVLAVTLFCMNFLGDGLRDALDPKMEKK